MNEEHVKLLILWMFYLSYMLLGTLIFTELEYDNEQRQVKYFKDLFEDFYSKTNVSKTDIEMAISIYRDSYSLGIDPSVHYLSKWDLAGSFYFVGTVITTIGFGYTAPVTRLGQICFIPYALIGIPLNILLFNTLLELTVQLFTFFLHRCYRFWRAVKRRIARKNTSLSSWEPTATSIAFLCMIFVIIITVISAPLFLFLEGWSFFESVYFGVVAFTTVGFGDFVPSGAHSGSGQNLTPHYKIGNWLVILIGMIFTYPAMAVMASVYKNILNFVFEKCRKFIVKKTNRVIDRHASSSTEHVGGRTRDTGGLSAEEKEKITARHVLKAWKGLKRENNIGTINTVEASILRSRLSPNNRGDQESTSKVGIAEGLQTIDELDAAEARLTREYKQLLNDIEEHRDSIKNKSVENDMTATGESIGMTNEGIGIAISICSPPVSERKEVLSSQSETTNLSPSPPSTD